MREINASPHSSMIDEDGGMADHRALRYAGRIHLSAGAISLIGMGGAEDSEITGATLLMSRSIAGIYCNLTPDQLRNLATQMIAIADLADANSARMASDVIAAAKRRP